MEVDEQCAKKIILIFLAHAFIFHLFKYAMKQFFASGAGDAAVKDVSDEEKTKLQALIAMLSGEPKREA